MIQRAVARISVFTKDGDICCYPYRCNGAMHCACVTRVEICRDVNPYGAPVVVFYCYLGMSLRTKLLKKSAWLLHLICDKAPQQQQGLRAWYLNLDETMDVARSAPHRALFTFSFNLEVNAHDSPS